MGKENNRSGKKKGSKETLKPISLQPLGPEEALKKLMEVDPEKVKEAERREKTGE